MFVSRCRCVCVCVCLFLCVFLEGSEEWVHVRIHECFLIGLTKQTETNMRFLKN